MASNDSSMEVASYAFIDCTNLHNCYRELNNIDNVKGEHGYEEERLTILINWKATGCYAYWVVHQRTRKPFLLQYNCNYSHLI